MDEMRCSSVDSNSAELAIWSTLTARPRTSSDSFASAPSDATCVAIPRNPTMAPSSCSIAAGSWELKAMRSILRDSSRPVSSTPQRLSARGCRVVLNAFGKAASLYFQCLDRLPRHRLLEHQADFGEVVTQRLHRVV